MSKYNLVVAGHDMQALKDELSKTHQVFCVNKAESLAEACTRLNPDLVVIEGGFGVVDQPAIVLINGDESVIERFKNAVAIVEKPWHRVGAAVKVAMANLERIRTAENEADSLRQTLKERKLIEQAKGLVMKFCDVDEDEAFRRMRIGATRGNEKVCGIARRIVEAGDLFRQLENGS